MDFAWFIYTIGIMAVAIVACSASMTVWVLTARSDCLVAGAGFLGYMLDVGIILFDEYAHAKPLMHEYFVSGLTHPVMQTVLRTAIVGCVWMWMLLRSHIQPSKRQAAALFGLLFAFFVALAPVGTATGSLRTFWYWAFSDLCIIASFAFVAWYYRHRASETERLDMGRSRRVFFAGVVLSLLILLEDLYFIVLYKQGGESELLREFFWHFTERNVSENFLMLLCAVSLVRSCRDLMRVFARHPAHDEKTLQDDRVKPDFEGRLLRFADDHGVSSREREVLALVLQGKDTQGIASALFISTGTVKAHMHRIYKKADVSGRQELINAFWRY